MGVPKENIANALNKVQGSDAYIYTTALTLAHAQRLPAAAVVTPIKDLLMKHLDPDKHL
jgi:hypothetical protein